MNDIRVNAAELRQALAKDIDDLLDEVVAAMNAAEGGRIIADSEEPVRNASAAFRQRLYEKALSLLQAKQEAFSPRPGGLKNKGKQDTTHQTINGRVRVCRTIYWSLQTGTIVPVDTWLGIDRQRFSPGVREMCCREALHCSFDIAGENLQRTAQLSLSGRTVRLIAEHQGRAVLAAGRKGLLGPGFTARQCTQETLITGTDGVMIPMVTEEQKQKRRATESAKRAAQGRRSTAKPGRPRSGSDGPYKEFKVLSFYDPDKSHCHVVATAGNHEVLGRLMRREGQRLGLGSAKIKYAVTDGAEWIARQYRQQLPMLDGHILDYYHLQEKVVETSYVLYGQGTPRAKDWQKDMMSSVWEHGSLVMLHRLGPYLRRHRSGPKKKALLSLRDYVGKRVAMTDYPAFRKLGYDCGSGPTESLCGTLSSRLKGSGMRWDKDNAENMMALGAIYHSRLWQAYWKAERKTG